MTPGAPTPAEQNVVRRRATGFTLIELLVVVAIIALLIAILLPALRSARQQARRAVCLSNLRQLTVAWHFYLDDHTGFFLQGINVNYNYGGAQTANQLRPYPDPDPNAPISKPLNSYLKLDRVLSLEHSGAFHCPCDTGGMEAVPSHFAYYGTSYMTNLMLIAQDELNINPWDPVASVLEIVNTRLPRMNVSRASTNHATLLLLADGGWWNSQTIEPLPQIDWHEQRSFHNAAFLDGHASFTRFRKGLYVTQDYAVIPFKDLSDQAARLQRELPDN